MSEGDVTEYRLAWIAGNIQKVRSASGTMRTDTTVLLDAGDFFQGNILSNLLNGDPVSEAMDVMKYDAVTGNLIRNFARNEMNRLASSPQFAFYAMISKTFILLLLCFFILLILTSMLKIKKQHGE